MEQPGRGRPGHVPVSMERVAGTCVSFSKAGDVWVYNVTHLCFLGLTSLCTFSTPKICLNGYVGVHDLPLLQTPRFGDPPLIWSEPLILKKLEEKYIVSGLRTLSKPIESI